MTNPGSVGGAGRGGAGRGGAGAALALQILSGEAPAEKTVLVDPVVWDNTSDAGKALLASAANPSLSPEWPVSVSIPGWTTYTMDQIIACKGPGE